MRKIRKDPAYNAGVSLTKPGQSLIPAELLKRHLAGTLPPIAKVPQYTHNEMGKQFQEDLSCLELHELHDLYHKMKREIHERANAERIENAKNSRQSVIDDYLKKQAASATNQTQNPLDSEAASDS